MIPKIIHYCWFGEKPIPNRLKKCLDSWTKFMPEYQLMRWDEKTFDVNSVKWTSEAYRAKKYAFVSDYVRLVALYRHGGIYFDTDVMVKTTFDPLLKYKAFTGFENDLYLTSAVIGCEKNFPLILEFLDTYKEKSFLNDSGEIDNTANVIMMTEICKKHGLMMNDTEQEIRDMHIFPREFFCPIDFYHNKHITEKTMAIHYFDASWLDEDTKKMVMRERTATHKIFATFKAFVADLIKRK